MKLLNVRCLGLTAVVRRSLSKTLHIERKTYEWIPLQKHWLKLNVEAVLGYCKASAAELRNEEGILLQHGPLK